MTGSPPLMGGSPNMPPNAPAQGSAGMMAMVPATGSAGSSSSPPPVAMGPADCIAATQPVASLALEFVVDESLAMVFPRDLWTPLTGALDGFVASQAQSQLAIGVQFFQGECDAAAHAVSDLPIAPAAQLPALDERMGARSHGAGAATSLALSGAAAEAELWSTSHGQRAALVLISASEPSACGGDAESAAMAGLSRARPVPTYVIALRELASLERIAQAGGTGAALLVPQPISEQALAQALAGVAERAACEFALPPEAAPYLPDRVNVRLTRDGTGELLPRVAGAGSCDPLRGGFYYDDAQAPAHVRICPTSCSAWQAGGSLELVYGCAAMTP